MTALYRNDRPGRHAPSFYAEGLPEAPERPALAGDLRADVAILGAGYTGLWAALRLARAGRRVVVLDAHRVGFGASGRNGGQVHSGFNASMRNLEQTLGPTRAHAMWDLSERAKAEVQAFCATDAPEAAFRPGVADGVYSAKGYAELQAEVAHLRDTYGATAECLDESTFRDLVKSPLYRGGVLDRSAGHLDPMAYATALARAAEAAGADIFELSEVTDIIDGPTPALVTAGGRVTADHLVIAGNGYLPNIAPKVNARVMPINSFIAATAPLPDRWQGVLAEDIAVADSRFVVNYYRFTPDRRFLFGGRESYSIGFPRDISTALVARMEALFPQLKGVEVTHV
ncbi:MAG: FAD-binding oxidoreductase, partial [Octadecabacter sp.]|nr:FAD-binding oxidoreductase [Octadecabacter sp.]